LVGSFTESEEWVEATVEEPTAVGRLTVLWPAAKPPSKVCYEQWSHSRRDRVLDITDRLQDANGRKIIRYEIFQPAIDTVHRLTWRW
jgi:hypothetical protein